jgi:hypothetical protein
MRREAVIRIRCVIAGSIRQEILSGIRAPAQFKPLRDRLRAFPDIELERDDYEEAAACFNQCRVHGERTGLPPAAQSRSGGPGHPTPGEYRTPKATDSS